MATLKQAVKANCKDCIYDPGAGGNFLEQIEACTITSCHLHEHRPITSATKQKLKEATLALLTNEQRQNIEELRNERARIFKFNMNKQPGNQNGNK